MGGGPKFEVDESQLPVLFVRYPPTGTLEDFDALWMIYLRVAQSNPRVAYLIDMRRFDALSAPAHLRKRAGELYAAHVDELAVSAVCEARVVSNALVKGILVAFDWVKGESRWPCRTFTDPIAARRWVDDMLGA